jgi:hypothetical protein
MFVELARGRSILVTEDGEPTDQFMLWQPALSDAEIDGNLARISRVGQAFEEHPYFPWVAPDFRPTSTRSGPARPGRDRTRRGRHLHPRCGRRLRPGGQLGLGASSPCSNRMQAGCAFHLAMRNRGSQPPVSSRSSRDRLAVPASVLAQRLLLESKPSTPAQEPDG